MDFFKILKPGDSSCVCVCVSGEREGFTGARIGYPRVKKTYCLNAALTGLYKRTSPKTIMQCKLILQFGCLAVNPKKLSEALGAKILIILPRFGSSMSFWYAFYLDIHVQ